MKENRMFWVMIPHFMKNPNSETHPEKKLSNVTASGRIVVDEHGNFIFDAKDPAICNSKQPTIAVYALITAVAIHLGKMSKVFPNVKTVTAGIKLQDESHVEVSVSEIKNAVATLFRPDQGKGTEWSQIINGTVRELEPYVVLDETEKEQIIETARLITEAKTPTSADEGKEIYNFEGDELKFAPNTWWAIWALENARKTDPQWIDALPRDKTLNGKDSRAVISWILKGSRAEKRITGGGSFYYGKKTARDYGV